MPLIDDLVRSATFGFGSSFGRNIYSYFKNNPAILIPAMFLVIAWSARSLFTGNYRNGACRLFLNGLLPLFGIFLGSTLLLGLATLLTDFESSPPDNTAYLISLGLIGISIFAGVLWGLTTGGAQKRAIEVETYNREFLRKAGLKEAGLDAGMLTDEGGNLLKLKERHPDRIVFTISGKRGRRAVISVENGRFISYSGSMSA